MEDYTPIRCPDCDMNIRKTLDSHMCSAMVRRARNAYRRSNQMSAKSAQSVQEFICPDCKKNVRCSSHMCSAMALRIRNIKS